MPNVRQQSDVSISNVLLQVPEHNMKISFKAGRAISQTFGGTQEAGPDSLSRLLLGLAPNVLQARHLVRQV